MSELRSISEFRAAQESCVSTLLQESPSSPSRPVKGDPHVGSKSKASSNVQRFKELLLKRELSLVSAWRRLLDTSWNMTISKKEFCDACRKFNVFDKGDSLKA